MSDTIRPIQQLPTPCDFGPFAGGYCGRLLNIEVKMITGKITTSDLEIELFENATASIDLNDLITSTEPIDWTKTTFSTVTGTITFDNTTGILVYKPIETPTIDRTIQFDYTVFDTMNTSGTGNITVNVIDKTPSITVSNSTFTGTEGQVYTLDTRTKTTVMNTSVDYTDASSVIISSMPSEGTVNVANGIITYTPSQQSSITRTISFRYKVRDITGLEAEATVNITLSDITPVMTISNSTFNGTEGQVYTINVSEKVTLTNTSINYSDPTSVVVSSAPSEGTVNIANGVITYTPSQTPSTNRTITFRYKVKDLSGLEAEATVSLTLSDITPALTTTNFTKTLVDNVTLTGSILSNITIKNDTFKTLTFGTISEGQVTASGSNYTFIPDATISSNRSVTIPYTITTNSGLTSTSNITVTITDHNIWVNTFWYGNYSGTDVIKSSIEEFLTPVTKTAYAGTYALTAGTGVYKYFVYPKSWGISPIIVDAMTLFEISVDDFKYITINGIELVVIRTYYQVNGAITVKFM